MFWPQMCLMYEKMYPEECVKLQKVLYMINWETKTHVKKK